ncbi:hypothetical protein [Novosphingobium olei]|uniref:Uncharacterized protein n=1 Tax=Novosphingobium olei TaxID=2728851 RepID=A0A7Y0GAE1_9SPHN|nr:hypothetical protein [Novosphingobium olei]NML95166.1 hypothetical protein [Novosphingobium olei]
MKRTPPSSPQLAEAGLDRALDLLGTPAVPAGLAARITAEVVRLPQLPAEPVAVLRPREALPPLRPSAEVTPRRAPARRVARWQIGVGAALAASLAAIALVGLPNPQADAGVNADVDVADSSQVAAAPIAGAPVTVAPAQQVTLGAAAPVPTARGTNRQAATPAGTSSAPGNDAATPETPLAPLKEPAQPSALASADPAKPVGPVAGPSAEGAAPALGSRGQMGPALPQGYGYTGGAPGSIPSGAPVTMSGGPGSAPAGPGGPGGPGGGAHPF